MKRYVCFFLLFLSVLSSVQSEPVYSITETELTAIQTECENLRIQIADLKSSQSSDSALLKNLEEQLKNQEEREAKLLAGSNLQLGELRTSLKQSERAARWRVIKYSLIAGLAGIGAGFIAGAILAN